MVKFSDMGEVAHLKKVTIFLIAVFLIGIGAGWYESEHRLPSISSTPHYLQPFESNLIMKTTPLRIVGIGDSLTRGVGDPKEQGYAGIVATDLRTSDAFSSVELTDEGVTGDTTANLLNVLKKKRVQNELSKANLIFLTIGGNDLVDVLQNHFLSLDLNEFDTQRKIYEANLNEILTEVRLLNPTATIYYMGLYNPFEDYFTTLNKPFTNILKEWNSGGATVLELYPNTVFIPTFNLFHGKTNELLYKDHFHPNPKGYHLIAHRILAHFDLQNLS